MGLKDYISINTQPILENKKNIFLLLWLEKKGFATVSDISKSTNISTSEIICILQILYKNELVSVFEDEYKITPQGIQFLDILGYSDMQIHELLSQTSFNGLEYEIYDEMFSLYRKNYLDIYLFMISAMDNLEHSLEEDIIIELDKFEFTKSEYMTLVYVNLFHQVGHIIYATNETNLFNLYNKLFSYSETTYCFSSEKYHLESSFLWYQARSTKRDLFNDIISRRFDTLLSNYFTKLSINNESKLYNYLLLDINADLKLSNQIFNDNRLMLNNLFTFNSLHEVAHKLDISVIQSKFILKSLQSKINELMYDDERHKELERFYEIQHGDISFKGKQFKKAISKNLKLPKTQDQLAKEMGISFDNLQNYKLLANKIPELEDLVDTGIVAKQ